MKLLEKLIKKPKIFQRAIGLSLEQFNLLVSRINPLWSCAENNRKSRTNRLRKIGGGRSYKLLTMEEKVFAVLLYYKSYLTQEFLGILVELEQSNVSRLLAKMQSLIEAAADSELATYLSRAKEEYEKIPRNQRINNWNDFLKKHPDLKDVSGDVTEQKCYRSSNNETQKKHYSGKKKLHTNKTQIVVSENGRILDVSHTYPGSVHDKKVAETEKTPQKFPDKTCQRYDAGYQGLPKENQNSYLVIPFKKPKGGELSPFYKQLNQIHSRRRVVAEHAISRVKKFKILQNTYRGDLKNYNQVFRNVAALNNFKLANRAAMI